MTVHLEHKANVNRTKVLEAAIKHGGHIASSFSCIEILVAIYYGRVLNICPAKRNIKDRDRFILSKGHAETALFAILSDLKFFPQEWFESHYRTGKCFLGGHPDRKVAGVEVTTGALGHGLGLGAGISLAAKMNSKKHMQYVLLGDAECTEGSVWEAALFSAKNKLNNLIAIIDYNKIGSIDFLKNFTSLDPLKNKWKAFGWEVKEIDGHDINELLDVLRYSKTPSRKKPLVIIAHTIKGKGVSFMENNPVWHVKNLTDDYEITQARKELNA